MPNKHSRPKSRALMLSARSTARRAPPACVIHTATALIRKFGAPYGWGELQFMKRTVIAALGTSADWMELYLIRISHIQLVRLSNQIADGTRRLNCCLVGKKPLQLTELLLYHSDEALPVRRTAGKPHVHATPPRAFCLLRSTRRSRLYRSISAQLSAPCWRKTLRAGTRNWMPARART